MQLSCPKCAASLEISTEDLFDTRPGSLQILQPELTLRDQFAMAALASVKAAWKLGPGEVLEFKYARQMAEYAYSIADAMLEARKR